ncbi:MAG: radical SAM protein [Candidatus Paceibacterota bacterium]|nr:MAG: radical SAM protein [Candidatus Paceibacterota bacterium]
MYVERITDRIDAITKIPEAYRTTTPPPPKSVKIELTGRCNYRCGFCALRTREAQPTQDMSWDFYACIVSEMRNAGVQELGVFFLGEPFMNPDLLVRAIRYAKKEVGFPYVFLTTNGSLAQPEYVQACIEAGLNSLKWSLNNADPEQFARVTGARPSLWNRALHNMEHAKAIRDRIHAKTGHRCILSASSIQYDGDQQKKMQALVDDILPFIDQHYWLPLYSMGSLAAQREKELGYRPIAGNQGRIGALRDPLPCWSAFTEGHITSSGNLSACCFDADERWAMADLNTVGFMEGWHSAAFQKLRAAHLQKDVRGTVCQLCVAYT